jgi:Zn ribbon nucleic-acid-binding protein
MTLHGIPCSKCKRTSFWKRWTQFEISIYECQKCGNTVIHHSVQGTVLLDVLERESRHRKLTLVEQNLVSAYHQLQHALFQIAGVEKTQDAEMRQKAAALGQPQ